MTLTERLDAAIADKQCLVSLMRTSAYGAGSAVKALQADIDLLADLREGIIRLREDVQAWQQRAVTSNPQYGRFLHPGGPHEAADLGG